ncbi:MAG TPA: ROK family transcriptional regulator [Acidimicrobiales bacterium]|nr:ROK family transcriptional regulator [Acidimicrobiales bacterium]
MSTKGRATVRDLRRVNRGAVLRRLFLQGSLNRVALAQITGLSSGSVTNVTAALLEEGLICEVGLEESDGGRPRVLLEVNPDFGSVIGVEVGETCIRVEAFDLHMRVVAAVEVPLHPQHHDAEVAIDQISGAIEKLQAQFNEEGRRLLGVGVAVPGVVAEHDGESRVHAPNIGWRDVPLEAMIRQRAHLPVFADNGAKALGQAEMWLGAGRGVSHAIVALWGTGVGAAIFTNGTIYRGSASSAGEWGHTSIVAEGKQCRCGGSGCVEAYIGGGALLEEWYRTDPDAYPLSDPDSEEWVDAFLKAARTHEAAGAALDRAGKYFGIGAANLVNLFNPEKIIIGGWLGLKLGTPLLANIRRAMREQALEYTANRVSIEVGQLGAEAVALGASTLVVDELLANGGTPPVIGAAKYQKLALGR